MSQRRGTAGSRAHVGLVALAVLVVLLVGLGVVRWAPWRDASPQAAPRSQPAPTKADPTPARVSRATTLTGRPVCRQGRGGFAPTSISIPGVTRAASVVTPPRDASDIPGTPPLTSAGKDQFAWDLAQGTRPGGRAGHVLLNAHAWPDGSALGNRLVASLHDGDPIVVRGDGRRLCYKVVERVQVVASDGLPRYYATHGPSQLAILTCSGRRLGPGVWTERTIWFAAPSAARL